MLDDVDILSWLENAEPVKPAFSYNSAKSNTLTTIEESGLCFEINREILLSLLTTAIPVVPTKDIVPVLLNIELVAGEGLLTINANSLSMGIVVSTEQFECKTNGTGLIPAKTFITMVKEAATGSNIFIEFTSRSAIFVAGGFSAEISLTAQGNFPQQEDISTVEFHSIERKSFIEAINLVKYALPGKEFSGQDSLQMISIRAGKFTVCDGARFQQARIPGLRLNMQLASYSISNLLKFLTASDMENIEVGETENKLIFRLDNKVFFLKKLNDPYPNVEQLWLRPALANDQELLVDKQELVTAIKQVKIAADSNAIALNIEESELTVSAKDVNELSIKSVIGCKWAKKPRSIVVNYLHLAEMLKAYSPKECRFLLAEDSKGYKTPVLLKDDDTLAIATIPQMSNYRAGLA